MVWKRFAEMRTVGMLLLLVFASIIAVCRETATPARTATRREATIVPQFAIEDFDGDSKPDIATVLQGRSGSADNHYRIRFQLSSGGSQNIDLTAPAGGLDISSRDVNGDDFLDVVVTTAGTDRPVAVLLNDGAGTFTASDPSAFPGAFRNSSHFWRALTEELPEASPAFYSRSFSSDLEASNGTFSLPVEIEVFSGRSERLETRDAEIPYLGRAPPFLEHTL
jgi:FG-GAP-like repeat